MSREVRRMTTFGQTRDHPPRTQHIAVQLVRGPHDVDGIRPGGMSVEIGQHPVGTNSRVVGSDHRVPLLQPAFDRFDLARTESGRRGCTLIRTAQSSVGIGDDGPTARRWGAFRQKHGP